jgi:hypothetical protein
MLVTVPRSRPAAISSEALAFQASSIELKWAWRRPARTLPMREMREKAIQYLRSCGETLVIGHEY